MARLKANLKVPRIVQYRPPYFEGTLDGEALKILTDSDVSDESLGCRQNVGTEEGFESEPHRNRTCNLLIKSQLLCQLS